MWSELSFSGSCIHSFTYCTLQECHIWKICKSLIWSVRHECRPQRMSARSGPWFHTVVYVYVCAPLHHSGSVPSRLVGPAPWMSPTQYFYCACCSPMPGGVTQPSPIISGGSPYNQVFHMQSGSGSFVKCKGN